MMHEQSRNDSQGQGWADAGRRYRLLALLACLAVTGCQLPFPSLDPAWFDGLADPPPPPTAERLISEASVERAPLTATGERPEYRVAAVPQASAESVTPPSPAATSTPAPPEPGKSDELGHVAPIVDANQKPMRPLSTREYAEFMRASTPVYAGPVDNCPVCNSCSGDCPPDPSAPFHPRDEYLCDGGDAATRVVVGRQGRVSGLDLEDTVAHFQDREGRNLVTPSNHVCIYAPRFAAVRKVNAVRIDDRVDRMVELEQPLPPLVERRDDTPLAVDAPLPVIRDTGVRGPVALLDRTRGLELANQVRVTELVDELQTYEDFQIIRIGIDKGSEKAMLAESIVAAQVWSDAVSPEVLLDLQEAVIDTTVERTGVIYRLDEPDSPCIRLIKLASTNAARPGEEVEFTLRYDNLGDQTIEQVTLIDNLTTRLEFIPNSSQSDRKATFLSESNDGDSLTLRWDLHEPIKPGEGGIIRFRCRVR